MAATEAVGRTAGPSTRATLSTTAALFGAAGTLEHADEGSQPALSLPDELLAARDRVATARARTSRTATRRRSRHRLGTVALVGSAVLATVAITEGYARTHLPGVANGTAGGAAASSTANLSTLGGISRVLAADQQLIASLVKTEGTIASRYASAARAAGVSHAAAKGAVSGGVAASGAASSGTSPATSLPPLPALPPVPAVSAPAAHATTGASSVP
ncbi:MAG: hypothetical protein ACYCTE_07230 [Acidimicrobiales bacterium]